MTIAPRLPLFFDLSGVRLAPDRHAVSCASVASLLPGADARWPGPAFPPAPHEVVVPDIGATDVLLAAEAAAPCGDGIAPLATTRECGAGVVQQSDSPTGFSGRVTTQCDTNPLSSPTSAPSTFTSTTAAPEERRDHGGNSRPERSERPRDRVTANGLDPDPAQDAEVERFLNDLRRDFPGGPYSIDETRSCIMLNGKKFCGLIRVASIPRRLDRTGRAREVEFLDTERHLHRVVVLRTTRSTGPGGLLEIFVDRGFDSFCDPLELLAFLQAWEGVPHSWLAEQAGWFIDPGGQASYIRPDGTVHQLAAATPVVLSMSHQISAQRAGSLRGWQDEVAARALGNPALIFAISAALTGPLLRLACIPTCGFNFFGNSGIGKSLLLQLALSCGGDPEGLAPWAAAQTGLHRFSVMSQDGLIALDGFPRDPDGGLAKALLAIADDAGSGRIVSPRDPDGVRRWRRVLLSSSELPLTVSLRRKKKEPPAALLTRVVDLPAECGPHGLVADLHGCADGVTFARSLQAALRRHYGHVLPAFLDRLVSDLDAVAAGLTEDLPHMTAEVQGRADAVASPVCHLPIAERFALVALAGELAIRWGLLPWPPGTATEAVTPLARLARLDGAAGPGATPALARLSVFLTAHQDRIIDLDATDSPQDTPADAIGWQDDKHLYLHRDTVHDELAELDALLEDLNESGALLPGGEQRSLQYRMPATKVRHRPRVYRVDREKLASDLPSQPE